MLAYLGFSLVMIAAALAVVAWRWGERDLWGRGPDAVMRSAQVINYAGVVLCVAGLVAR